MTQIARRGGLPGAEPSAAPMDDPLPPESVAGTDGNRPIEPPLVYKTRDELIALDRGKQAGKMAVQFALGFVWEFINLNESIKEMFDDGTNGNWTVPEEDMDEVLKDALKTYLGRIIQP